MKILKNSDQDKGSHKAISKLTDRYLKLNPEEEYTTKPLGSQKASWIFLEKDEEFDQ
jgi:hypothetical protein